MTDAKGFVASTDGIAVLSDFSRNQCHIFSGKFGIVQFSLPPYMEDNNSSFEDMIFDSVIKDDLLERHVLELRFFNFLQSVHADRRKDYAMSCVMRIKKGGREPLSILHSSRYLQWHSNGSVWLGLCMYMPIAKEIGIPGSYIIDTARGETVPQKRYAANDSKLLSKRQTQILSLLSKGTGSKQIADMLNLSVFTVNRHRQDILSALRVSNTASAVEIALRLHLI